MGYFSGHLLGFAVCKDYLKYRPIAWWLGFGEYPTEITQQGQGWWVWLGGGGEGGDEGEGGRGGVENNGQWSVS